MVRSTTILVVEVGVVDGVLEVVLVAAVEGAVMLKLLLLEILASSLPWGPSELCSSCLDVSCVVFMLSKSSTDLIQDFFI